MAAGIAKLDAGNGLVYFIARAEASGYRDISGYIRAGLVPGVVLACIAGVMLYPRLGPLAAVLPAMVAADVLLAATRGFGAMRPVVVLEGVLLPACQLVLVAGAAVAGDGAWLAPAWGLPYVPVLILAAIALRNRMPHPPSPQHTGQAMRPPEQPGAGREAQLLGPPGAGRVARLLTQSGAGRVVRLLGRLRAGRVRSPGPAGMGRELWRYTAPRSVAGAIQAVFQRVDIVVVAVLGGPEQAAVYTAATRFKVVGQLAGQGLAQAVQAGLVRALACGDVRRARELYQSTTIWLVLLTWPLWLVYGALAPWVLRLFGPTYGSAAPVALVLAGTMMVATACGTVDVVLTAAGHTGTSLLNLLAAVACTLALDLALIPSHGALGAVVGWSGGVLVKNLLPLWQLHRRYGLHPFGRHTLPALRIRPRPAT
ncbi:lipopolysaccharide biosynthesis protein [Nonomuraea sp. K274]|uniref:Lipopolysaccharide biosynthesis protein n=2 Tax=Nonomuraea cypriaca TaxID=1187855 RepID=A0A931F2P3_9ACTN|nr:lipopolysaccharide biosynthesis protein [Nonomuraea cypriaca]